MFDVKYRYQNLMGLQHLLKSKAELELQQVQHAYVTTNERQVKIQQWLDSDAALRLYPAELLSKAFETVSQQKAQLGQDLTRQREHVSRERRAYEYFEEKYQAVIGHEQRHEQVEAVSEFINRKALHKDKG